MNNEYIFLGDNKIAPYNPDKDGAYLIISSDVVEVVKEPTHEWKVNQILVEKVHFEFKERWFVKDEKDRLANGTNIYTVGRFAVPIKSIVEESLEDERLGDDLEPEVHGND